MFALPNLPRDWYFKMKDLCVALDVTQWQMVIIGLATLIELGQRDKAKVEEIVAEVKARYSKGARNEGVDRQ